MFITHISYYIELCRLCRQLPYQIWNQCLTLVKDSSTNTLHYSQWRILTTTAPIHLLFTNHHRSKLMTQPQNDSSMPSWPRTLMTQTMFWTLLLLSNHFLDRFVIFRLPNLMNYHSRNRSSQ